MEQAPAVPDTVSALVGMCAGCLFGLYVSKLQAFLMAVKRLSRLYAGKLRVFCDR